MGQIVVNVGSFDLTSHNGNTAYSSVRYFDIPANAGITGCTATFAHHVNTGSFQGKSFSLNGAQAHPNTPWPMSGIALNTALLATGQNTFRAAVKSQAGLSARWAIGDIYLTITYNDVGGGGQPIRNIGTLSVAPSTLTAGSSININIGACDGDLVRDVVIAKADGSTPLMVIATGWGSVAKTWTVEIPVSWCSSIAPDDPDFTVVVYSEAFVIGGGYGGKIGCPVTVSVPSTAMPTIGTFTATLNKNGVDASITGYVQNYSKVDLEVIGASGALGSTISAYEIIGGGWSGDETLETFGPFSQSGDITFTAKVTDTRGRTVTGSVTINVLPYTPVSAVSISAFRADSSGDPDDEGTYAALKGKRVYSLLGGENTATISGRVFEKGTTPSSWSVMMDDTPLLIGSLSIEKGYTAQITIADKITSVVYIVEIPTSIVGIHIVPGATGGGFGMYGVSGRWDFSAPIFSPEGACPGIGDILYTLNPTHPAIRYPGTTWAAHEGVFLLGADEVHEAEDTGGEETHTLTVSEIPNHQHVVDLFASGGPSNPNLSTGVVNGYYVNSQGTSAIGGGQPHNNMPPFLVVYIWERTA